MWNYIVAHWRGWPGLSRRSASATPLSRLAQGLQAAVVAVTVLTMTRVPEALADSNAMTFSYKEDNFPFWAMAFRLIHANGVFVEHTADRFRLFVQENNIAEAGSVAATVILDSDGGSVAEALNMGRFIRQMGFDTEVESNCFSSCTIAFLGGVHRYIGANAKFGVHRISSASPLDSASALDLGQISIAQIAEYAQAMGIGPSFVSAMMEAGPNDINLLSQDQLLAAKIISPSFSTQWEIKVRDGHFYLLSSTETNNGYHKMIFICDGKGGMYLEILYNATGEFQEDVLKWTTIYELDIDGKEIPLRSNEIVGRVNPSGASYVLVTVQVSPRIYSLLASARILGFKMLPPSRMIYAGWDSDFASGHDKFIEYARSCELHPSKSPLTPASRFGASGQSTDQGLNAHFEELNKSLGAAASPTPYRPPMPGPFSPENPPASH